MLNVKMQEALNRQLNAELFSAYLYLSMAACLEDKGFPGMAQWMRLQAQEEYAHGMKIYDFINERNGRVTLAAIDAPKTDWDSPLDVFEEAYMHEQKVTGLINDLVNLAITERDHAAASFLQWFINEQVEEEATVARIIDQLRLVGGNGVALYMIDQQLGQRGASASGPAH
jgi:ferritin